MGAHGCVPICQGHCVRGRGCPDNAEPEAIKHHPTYMTTSRTAQCHCHCGWDSGIVPLLMDAQLSFANHLVEAGQ